MTRDIVEVLVGALVVLALMLASALAPRDRERETPEAATPTPAAQAMRAPLHPRGASSATSRGSAMPAPTTTVLPPDSEPDIDEQYARIEAKILRLEREIQKKEKR